MKVADILLNIERENSLRIEKKKKRREQSPNDMAGRCLGRPFRLFGNKTTYVDKN